MNQRVGNRIVDSVVPRIVPGVPVDPTVAERHVDIEGSTSRRIDSVKNTVVGRLGVTAVDPKCERHLLIDGIKRGGRNSDIPIGIELDGATQLSIRPHAAGDRAVVGISRNIGCHHAGGFIKRVPSHRSHYDSRLKRLEQTQSTPLGSAATLL
ncbi:hypothetical protein Poly51_43780 [Rubripirellula tenax]|uniref:Uncharacterized protein n=1 Tax=Rubripirellula tenax TaxID=2528015 RepID=A0A5C6ERV6_9BACT|nr:hypothetical protein Poly51_43780 [Rubripirellula tenax]